MTDAKLVELYERIRKEFGPSFAPDLGGYTMQREVDGLVISLEPPQERLAPGEYTSILLTAPLKDKTPEELSARLSALISKRDALAQQTWGMVAKRVLFGHRWFAEQYKETLRDYDEGIEYVYEVPTPDERLVATVVRDFGSI